MRARHKCSARFTRFHARQSAFKMSILVWLCRRRNLPCFPFFLPRSREVQTEKLLAEVGSSISARLQQLFHIPTGDIHTEQQACSQREEGCVSAFRLVHSVCCDPLVRASFPGGGERGAQQHRAGGITAQRS